MQGFAFSAIHKHHHIKLKNYGFITIITIEYNKNV